VTICRLEQLEGFRAMSDRSPGQYCRGERSPHTNKPADILERLRTNLEERVAHDNEETQKLTIMERDLEHMNERVEYRRWLKRNRTEEIVLLRRDIEKLETETQTVSNQGTTTNKRKRRYIGLN